MFARILSVCVCCLFLLSCSEVVDKSNEEFFRSIENAFLGNETEVDLTSIFQDSFSELCFFSPDSSMPDEVMQWIKTIEREKNIKGDFSYKGHFLVFITINDGVYKTYSKFSKSIEIQGIKHWVSTRVLDGYGCVSKGSGALRIVKNPKYKDPYLMLVRKDK